MPPPKDARQSTQGPVRTGAKAPYSVQSHSKVWQLPCPAQPLEQDTKELGMAVHGSEVFGILLYIAQTQRCE
eukprot:1150908-Pelagomonas_calceolata.AAC.3